MTPNLKKRRKLTPFLAQEMLYDFVTGDLDAERSAAVSEYLSTDGDGQRMQAHILSGLKYAALLEKTQVSPETVAHLRDAENVVSLGKKYSSWREWPEAIRWSLIAVLVSTSVAATVAILPWPTLIAMFGRSSATQQPAAPTQTIAANISPGQLQEDKEPENGDGTDAKGESEGEARESSGDDISDQTEDAAAPTPAPAVVAANKKATVIGGAGSVAATAPQPTGEDGAENSQTGSGESEKKAGKPKGFVYRANMQLSNLEEVGPKIAQMIKDLGGEKAGEVELGWKRGSGRYYHFSLPDMNEKKLMDSLQVYGPVRISKDPHPRVMPNGQVRFILWIESAN